MKKRQQICSQTKVSAITDASFWQLDGLGKETKAQMNQLKGEIQELKSVMKEMQGALRALTKPDGDNDADEASTHLPERGWESH